MQERATPQPEYEALMAFDAENNVEPSLVIAQRIAIKNGYDRNQDLIDDINHAVDYAMQLGQRRAKYLPQQTRSDP